MSAQLETTTSQAGSMNFPSYEPHPIEAESYRIIQAGRDWEPFPQEQLSVLYRLVHTSGDFKAADEVYFSVGAIEAGKEAIRQRMRIVTDVTMVQTGFKRALLAQLGLETWCGVHDEQTFKLAKSADITRSAAGMRRAKEQFGDNQILVIGDAPTAITEATRLIRQEGWRPKLVIGIPVGFVGTRESKDDLRQCEEIPRITNSGTRGGSPWAATMVNAMMIDVINEIAANGKA